MNSTPTLLSIPQYDYELIELYVPDTHKTRRHHNNKGIRQVRRGKTRKQVKQIAKRLNIPYKATL